jgi:hypothetical protein
VVLSSGPTITGTTTLGGTAVSAPAWSTNGIGIKQASTTYTDNSTPAGNTVTTAYMNLFGTATYDTSLGSVGTPVSVDTLYGNYFKAPAVTANISNINKYAVGIDTLNVTGTSKFDGNMGSISTASINCTSLIASNNSSVTGTFDVTGVTTITGQASAGITVTVSGTGLTATPASSGVIQMGRSNGTGDIRLGLSTASQTVNIAYGVTASGSTKTLNLGANGAAGSTTNITVGSTTGTSTTTMQGNTATPAGATAMTSGFFYIPAAAGAPSGTPTAITGTVPMYYDTTNNRFYIYNTAWKLVALV